MSIMQSEFSILFLAMVSIPFCCAQSGRLVKGQPLPPWPPSEGTAYIHLTPPPKYLQQSLPELVKASSLIIDGVVETLLPPREISQRTLETDVVFVIAPTLKGPSIRPRIIVSQRGGKIGHFTQAPTQYF